jgi:hypothetical protein
MQNRLQPELSVPLPHDRTAGVEVDVEILAFSCRGHKLPSGDLPRRDLDAGFRLGREFERPGIRWVAGQHHAIGLTPHWLPLTVALLGTRRMRIC